MEKIEKYLKAEKKFNKLLTSVKRFLVNIINKILNRRGVKIKLI